MNKKLLLTALFFMSFLTISMAQESSQESKGEDNNNEFSKRFFMAITTSTYMDLIVSPLKYHYAPTGNFTPGDSTHPSAPIYDDIPYQTQQFNIVSLGIEPRYNLKEFDQNSSLSISAPISFGIGNSFSAAGDDLVVRGVNGFGSLQVPLLLKLNFGNGSTYTTQKDIGFSVGAGLEMNKIGLINLTENAKQYNKAFFLPSLSTGFTFMRGDSPMEINFKYSFGKVRFQEFGTQGQGDVLKDATGLPYRRSARGQSIKLTFVYLLNY